MSQLEKHQTEINTTTSQKNFFGLVGLVIGVIAWIILYKFQWGGIALAIIGIMTSIIGLKGKFRNLAIAGIITSSTLLIVVAIMWAVFYYLFQSIK